MTGPAQPNPWSAPPPGWSPATGPVAPADRPTPPPVAVGAPPGAAGADTIPTRSGGSSPPVGGSAESPDRGPAARLVRMVGTGVAAIALLVAAVLLFRHGVRPNDFPAYAAGASRTVIRRFGADLTRRRTRRRGRTLG